jgi:hypothetical protein
MTSTVVDVFRYRDSNNAQLAGRFFSDNVCFANGGVRLQAQKGTNIFAASSSSKPSTSSSSKPNNTNNGSNNSNGSNGNNGTKPNTTNNTNTTVPLPPIINCTMNQVVFAVDLNNTQLPFNGAIGLGRAAPAYGNSFLAAFGNQWGLYNSPLFIGQGALTIGAASKALMKNSSKIFYYNFTSNTSYSLNVDGFSVGSSSLFTKIDITGALLQPEVDSLIIPNKTYTVLSAIIQTATKMTCNSTTVVGCFYNGPCSDIASKALPLSFTFGDSTRFTVPIQSLLQDDPTQNVCRGKIQRAAAGSNTIVLGLPWFKSFYTIFDNNNNVAGFTVGSDSFATAL